MVGNKNIYKDVNAGIFSLQGGLAGAPPPLLSPIPPPINSTTDIMPLINPDKGMVPYKIVI